MHWLLRRNFWVVELAGLVLITALAANTSMTLLASYLLSGAPLAEPRVIDDAEGDDDEPPGDGSDPVVVANTNPLPDARARQAERTAERILGHNPFCPTCGPSPPPVVEPDAPPLDPDDPDLAGAQRSALPLVVAATMESDDPLQSLATLVDVERGVGGLFGVGDRLDGNVEIVRVTTGVVHILNDGRLEYIPFGGTPLPPPPEPRATTKPAATPESAKSSIPGAQEAITCNDAGDCVVERAFVEQLIAQPSLLMGQGGVAPTTTKDGNPGFRLRSVRRGTLPDLLGLKSGDVITEVGGAPLTPDVIAGLFGKLRHASNIEVVVDRRGTRMARQLEIRS